MPGAPEKRWRWDRLLQVATAMANRPAIANKKGFNLPIAYTR
jgi:hypothetical protein